MESVMELVNLLGEQLANYTAEVINGYIDVTYVGDFSDPHGI